MVIQKRFMLIPLFFIGLIFLLLKGLSLDPKALPLAQINQPVPPFTLPLLGNLSKIVTEQDLTGRMTVVHFWASWCPSCRKELPLLFRLSQNKAIHLVGVNYRDEMRVAEHWLKNDGNPYEWTIFDPNGDLGFNWGVYGTPETFIIDENGVIRYRLSGPLSEKTVNEITFIAAS